MGVDEGRASRSSAAQGAPFAQSAASWRCPPVKMEKIEGVVDEADAALGKGLHVTVLSKAPIALLWNFGSVRRLSAIQRSCFEGSEMALLGYEVMLVNVAWKKMLEAPAYLGSQVLTWPPVASRMEASYERAKRAHEGAFAWLARL